MKKPTSFIILILFVISSSLYAQRVDSMMSVYAEKFPQQKVYVHFDKSVYRAGESIWFKAYIFAGFSPALASKNFYAELLDNEGNVIQRKVYPVSEASAAGNFDIPDNFSANNLRFRGYTAWMLNFDSSFFFTKELMVLNKTGASAPQVKQASNVSLRFFPEGGDLVSTLESVVAFKANDNYGMPVNVKGSIKNLKGEVVAAINTQHDGMGIFKLMPDINETYTATYTDDAGVIRTATLPVAKQEGAVLNIFSAGSKKVFVVKRTINASSNLHTVHLVAHVAQQVIYKAKIPLTKSIMNSGSFAIDQQPSGIIQFSLFDENWKPIAERIAMINNDDYTLIAKVEPITTNINKRAKNVFEIEVGDTLLSNLSVSVTDADIKEKPNSDNIISRLLLTGDLKGYVHNPEYYFADSSGKNNLDLVMLTNGWRRYNWGDVVQNKTPVIAFPDTSYLTLTAKVFGLSPSAPLRKDESITAFIRSADSSMQVLEMPKTGTDVFSQPNVVFFDTISVFHQFAKNRRLESKVTIKFDNGSYKGYNKLNVPALPPVSLSASDSALAKSRVFADQIIKFGSTWAGKGNVLETVTVKTRPLSALEEMDRKYASGLFSGSNAYSFDLLNDNAFVSDIFTFLESKVPGIRINRGLMGAVNVEWRNSPTSIFINEMSVDADYLSSLSVNDIAYVKVFRPPFFGASGGGSGGTIVIYTRRGGDAPVIAGKGLASNKVVGYSAYKEFYSPDYSTRSASADVLADYRSTLYWNPYILMDATKQKVQFQFYNNDMTTAFRVIVEGVNEEGKLVRIEKIIK
ncbi:MAG TPA: hypothetical protein VF622_10150 [Segetibacter sp.]|jgi:hypothetical protein